MRVARAAAAYFGLVFAAGFILGTIRTLIISPQIGEVASVALELPVMLAVSWWACGRVLGKWPIPAGAPVRLAMGAMALCFLLAAEVAVSTGLGGLTFREHLALYATLPVQLGLLGQIAYAAFPLLRGRP